MDLIKALEWRYATKKMNGQVVPQEKIDYILEAAKLAPSSSGIQPYQIFVISNKEVKEKLRAVAFDQSQITDASHVLVFAAWDGYSLEKISTVFDRTLAERGLPANTMDDYKNSLWGMYEPLGQEWHANHAARQAYISFGIALAAAAEQEVDATPMEGFVPAEVDKLLGLNELGLKSAVILTLGYRDEANDWLVNMKKVRTPKSEFITEIK
ncbi:MULTISPECIES: NAD(P)H-dependent oxidoreductase [Flavobacterium]|jgi:nitroreductase/dihydropteridine reductase|uniref:NAD(P)H-dependent oxidoreductase n=1 Tax=Flavobacterium cupriresistens TaxID=2893885 RepID=A0ABU4RF79_9FLAO|nr:MULTISPECIES: NAD(P)H-dependent oxidoreductase [unclassified Flavobacterium]KLT68348.1 nitroreductase [Flavobacterium sp. ABG]MDX6191258.1 NAD(P)H-dependent oxidoreductase [Flavobacterium sp. Fl-318]UFH42423.1 NAD(P)H-dependent oxidoreductase [Flavobacterium sp. F-323]